MDSRRATGKCARTRNEPACAPGAWRMSFERLEEVVPEMPFGIGDEPFEAVNLCVDVGALIEAAMQEDARTLAREVVAIVAHYRQFFWERRGVGTNVFVYWSSADTAGVRPSSADMPSAEEEETGRKSGAVRRPRHNIVGPRHNLADATGGVGEGLALLREILRAAPCVYAVETGAADAGVLPLWVARSERFGAVTGTPTIALTGASAVDMCEVGVASPRSLTYVLTMEDDAARFLPCARQATGACTNADATRIGAQVLAQDENYADTGAVAALIAERLGATDIPIGHLFDSVDPWD